METYKTETLISKDGTLFLKELPFKAGEMVEIIISPTTKHNEGKGNKYPLRGKPLRYDNPTDPVAEEDWEIIQ